MIHFLASQSYFISVFPKIHACLASLTHRFTQWHQSVSPQNHRSHQSDRWGRGRSVIKVHTHLKFTHCLLDEEDLSDSDDVWGSSHKQFRRNNP